MERSYTLPHRHHEVRTQQCAREDGTWHLSPLVPGLEVGAQGLPTFRNVLADRIPPVGS